jgi:hypothetical protein
VAKLVLPTLFDYFSDPGCQNTLAHIKTASSEDRYFRILRHAGRSHSVLQYLCLTTLLRSHYIEIIKSASHDDAHRNYRSFDENPFQPLCCRAVLRHSLVISIFPESTWLSRKDTSTTAPSSHDVTAKYSSIPGNISSILRSVKVLE